MCIYEAKKGASRQKAKDTREGSCVHEILDDVKNKGDSLHSLVKEKCLENYLLHHIPALPSHSLFLDQNMHITTWYF